MSQKHLSEINRAVRVLAKFKELKKLGEILEKYAGKHSLDFGGSSHTLFKLMFIQQYSALYTSIIGQYYAKWIYIDPYAGTGLDVIRIGNVEVTVPGSFIVASAFAVKPFSKVYICEKSNGKLELAKKRFQALLKYVYENPDCLGDTVLNDITKTELRDIYGSADHAIGKILEELYNEHERLCKESRRGLHYLMFLDPCGIEEIPWSIPRCIIEYWEKKLYGDVIMFWNAYGVAMLVRNNSRDLLNRFFGTGEWEDYLHKKANRELSNLSLEEIASILLEFYKERLVEEASNRGIDIVVRDIRLFVKLDERRSFYLLYIVRKTRGGSPFVKAVDYLKSLIENVQKDAQSWNNFEEKLGNYLVTGNEDEIIKNTIYEFMEELKKIFSNLENYFTSVRYGVKKRRFDYKRNSDDTDSILNYL